MRSQCLFCLWRNTGVQELCIPLLPSRSEGVSQRSVFPAQDPTFQVPVGSPLPRPAHPGGPRHHEHPGNPRYLLGPGGWPGEPALMEERSSLPAAHLHRFHGAGVAPQRISSSSQPGHRSELRSPPWRLWGRGACVPLRAAPLYPRPSSSRPFPIPTALHLLQQVHAPPVGRGVCYLKMPSRK